MRYLIIFIASILYSNLQAQDLAVKLCAFHEQCVEAYLAEKYTNFRAFEVDERENKVVIWIKGERDTTFDNLTKTIFDDWIFYEQNICKEGCENSDRINMTKTYPITYSLSKDNYIEWRTKLTEIESKLKSFSDNIFLIELDFLIYHGDSLDGLAAYFNILSGFKETPMPKVVVSVPLDYPFSKLLEIQNALYPFGVKVFFGGHRTIVD